MSNLFMSSYDFMSSEAGPIANNYNPRASSAWSPVGPSLDVSSKVFSLRRPGTKAVRGIGEKMRGMARPGLLMTAIGAGTAGAVAGDGSAQSFLAGSVAGMVGGYAAQAAATGIYRGLTSYSRKNAGRMAGSTMKAIGFGRALTGAGSRGAIFGAGALLAGGLFGSIFSSDKRDYSRGLNSQRGNGF